MLLGTEGIVRDVGDYYGVSLVRLRGSERHRSVAHARAVAMYLVRSLLGLSYPEIGSLFGNRDHSTAIAAVRKISSLRLKDSCLESDLVLLESRFRERGREPARSDEGDQALPPPGLETKSEGLVGVVREACPKITLAEARAILDALAKSLTVSR